jgi:hypothetical protein
MRISGDAIVVKVYSRVRVDVLMFFLPVRG